MKTILYIHGMGGGKDSRTPRALNRLRPDIRTVIRNYEFDPAKALPQIEGWVEELHPDMIICESMGANYGLLVGKGIPHIYLSPALGAPARIRRFCWLSLIPGMPFILRKSFGTRPGERQKLDFRFKPTSHFKELDRLVREALSQQQVKDDTVMGMFGKNDFYLPRKIVSIDRWEVEFGAEKTSVDGESHFWEEERVISQLLPLLSRYFPE